jgi:hypothetical protein
VRLLLTILFPALCCATAWPAYRRGGYLGLLGLLVICSVASGYLWYRTICSGALVCDVFDVNYLPYYAPRYALFALVAFGITFVYVVRSARHSSLSQIPIPVFLIAYCIAQAIWFGEVMATERYLLR